ncbi:histidine phosphatase family protein [Allonocardiopsis opalescens]|uniref:Putative phosphoglycerate mutase n=1 Tax=Allonocardiopsis opalescens TaxID=1144618 RepID=A0A2T0Q482_9ACTN|nr:histidine phosphatase family protein [Allonocardiopsis opalescens]PRX98628.1 putative phosphoglycerate mutase [Allonocardiopsis opalescens]
MSTVLFVRHGLTAVTGSTLLGWTPGVPLDERGEAQAEAVARRLAGLPLAAVVTSPLERCRQTAEAIAAGRAAPLVDERFGECGYGEWTGRKLSELAKEPLWRVVQSHPSAVRFPGGESMTEVAHRAVGAVRAWNAELGADAVYAVCSHGDVIKAIVADALGLHLDQFQRIQIDPCSVTAVRYTELRPFVLRLNDTDDLAAVLPPPPAEGGEAAEGSDAVVGGGAGGPAAPPSSTG